MIAGEFDQLIGLAPDQSVFRYPMSKTGKELLTSVLRGCMMWRQKFTVVKFMEALCTAYDPVKYDQFVNRHSFNVDKVSKAICKMKPRTLEDAIGYILLDQASQDSWREDNKVTDKPIMGALTSPNTYQVYKWLTRNFLLTDFNDFDLNKIVELSNITSLDVIKLEAYGVQDPTKRSVPFLYVVVKNRVECLAAQARIDSVSKQKQEQALSGVFDLARQTKKVHQLDPGFMKSLSDDADFAAIARKIKGD